MAVALVGAYIGCSAAGVALPDGYTEIMTLVCGFYFAKNGGNFVTTLRERKDG